MPSSVETPIQAYAHCTESRCPGNRQVPVEAIVNDMSWAYSETGGDGMFGHPERTARYLRFADPDQARCEHCGRNRDISETRRPTLEQEYGQQDFLLDIDPDLRSPDGYKSGGGHTVIDDERTSKLEAENQELREAIAELRGIMLGKQSSEEENPAPSPEEEE